MQRRQRFGLRWLWFRASLAGTGRHLKASFGFCALSSKVQNPLKPLGVCNATVKILCYRRLGQSQCCPGSRPTQPQNPAKPLKVCPLSGMTTNNKTCDMAKHPENPYKLLITNQCHVLLVFNSTCHDSYFDQQCSTLQEKKSVHATLNAHPSPLMIITKKK